MAVETQANKAEGPGRVHLLVDVEAPPGQLPLDLRRDRLHLGLGRARDQVIVGVRRGCGG